ncbi:MAG: recombinase family protein [Pseudomonadota bacterium]
MKQQQAAAAGGGIAGPQRWLDPVLYVQMLEMRAAGASFHAIAARLNRFGVKSAHGGRWYGASIHRILVPRPVQAQGEQESG